MYKIVSKLYSCIKDHKLTLTGGQYYLIYVRSSHKQASFKFETVIQIYTGLCI